MVKRVKCATALTLAFFLASWPLFSVLGIRFHKEKMKQQLELMLKCDAAEVLLLKKADFPSLQKQKEFDFRGQRFDVISIADEGSLWRVSAINDKKEKWLEEQAEKEAGKIGVFSGWFTAAPGAEIFQVRVPIPVSKLLLVAQILTDECGFSEVVVPPPKLVV